MLNDLEKFLDGSYSCFECYGVKGIRKGDYLEIIFKIKGTGVEVGRKWINVKNPLDNDKSKKKNTGGRASYYMVMKKEVDRLLSLDVKPEPLGYVWLLMPYIAWNTGLLVIGRKKRPLTFDDMAQIFKCSRKKTANIVNKLKEYGILLYGDDGYMISRNLVKKGGAKREKQEEQEAL